MLKQLCNGGLWNTPKRQRCNGGGFLDETSQPLAIVEMERVKLWVDLQFAGIFIGI